MTLEEFEDMDVPEQLDEAVKILRECADDNADAKNFVEIYDYVNQP